MLEHEQPETISIPPTAAEKRVTSEEFAHAVSAIEARNADQAKNLAGTLPIGEGIHELGLDASPEEVWAEVEAQRARANASQSIPSQVTTPQFSYQVKPVTSRVVAQTRPRRFRGWAALGVFFFIFGLTHHAFFPSAHSHSSHTASAPAAALVTRTLQEVPDKQVVYCDTATLRQILQGADKTKIRVDEGKTQNRWPLIKYDGQVYLRGYIVPTTAEAIEKTSVHLYNNDNAGELEGISQGWLTVRADAAHIHLDSIVSDPAGWTELDANHVHLDGHAFEDWSDDD